MQNSGPEDSGRWRKSKNGDSEKGKKGESETEKGGKKDMKHENGDIACIKFRNRLAAFIQIYWNF
jgi:hypothetical protein